jgi:autotransporter-associated beta strand protein
MRRLRRTQRRLAWAVCVVASALARHSQAQTVNSSFTGTNEPGWTFGGTGFTPYLTAPSIDTAGNGWLRLTDNNGNESTYALYTGGSLTGANRTIFASFDFTFWNNNNGPADGLTFFLYDASVGTNFNVGAFGGSLGYAQKTGIPGLSGGYLGIGLDVFGNYSNPTEGRVGGPGFLPNEVSVRGPASSNYAYIVGTGNGAYPGLNATTQNLNFPSSTSRPLQTGTSYRHADITLSPSGVLNVYIQFGAAAPLTLVMSADLSAYARPAQLGFGYTAGTGSDAEVTEIRNFSASSVVANLWANGDANSQWSDANSWNPAAVPLAGAQITFDNTYVTNSQIVNLINTNRLVGSVTFDAPFNYTLTNGVLVFTNVNPGVLAINATHFNGAGGSVTIQTPIQSYGDLNVDNFGGGPMTLNGAINLEGTNNILFAGSTNTIVNGAITNTTGYLEQFGTNTLFLNATNTYTGGTVLVNGGLDIGANNVLGTGALTIDGGEIDAFGGSRTITNSVNLAGNVILGGTNSLSFSGPILNNGSSNIITLKNTASTTLSGNLSLGGSGSASTLTLNGAGNATISGVISDGTGTGSSLVVGGTGTVILTSKNTYTGGTTVNGGGTLELDNTTGNALTKGTIALSNGSTLLFGANNQLASGVNITTGGNSVIALASGTSQTLANMGTLTLTGTSSIVFPSSGSAASINFAKSNDSSWTGILYVDNWSTNSLYFGNSASGLGTGQGPVFTNIIFVNPAGYAAGNYEGQILSSGQVVPSNVRVPEVGAFVYGGLLAGLVGWRHRRRLKLPDFLAKN